MSKRHTKFKKTSGVTLMELILVILLVAILIMIFITYFRSQIFRANDAKRKGDLDRIKIAVEEYEKDYNCYPPPSIMGCDPGNGLSPYLEKLPCDPTTKASYYYDYDLSSSCAKWYRIFTNVSDSDSAVMQDCGPGNAYNFYTSSPNAPSCQLQDIGGFYGCRSGVCMPILWDETRPGPECDPNFQSSTCFGQCNLQTECKPWK